MRTPRNECLSSDIDGKAAGPERTCILTRVARPKDALIRLVLGPDGSLHPDVRAKAPGRGAYLGVGKTGLDEAIANGKLKGALSRAFKQAVDVPADLSERIADALRDDCLNRLGLEARGGTLINGSERIEAAARAGKVHLLLHACDAGEDGNKRLDQAWRVGGGPSTKLATGPRGLAFPEDRTTLSKALGRENAVHVALTDRAAAARVLAAISRWQAFIDGFAGLDGGNAGAPALTDEPKTKGIK